jgi:hypothetical protein
MIDDTPYIIVDNQKIAPIERSPRVKLKAQDRTQREEQPFGIVDRVTISSEAREIARHLQAHAEASPQALTNPQAIRDLSPKPGTVNIPLLTYPSKPCR